MRFAEAGWAIANAATATKANKDLGVLWPPLKFILGAYYVDIRRRKSLQYVGYPYDFSQLCKPADGELSNRNALNTNCL